MRHILLKHGSELQVSLFCPKNTKLRNPLFYTHTRKQTERALPQYTHVTEETGRNKASRHTMWVNIQNANKRHKLCMYIAKFSVLYG